MRLILDLFELSLPILLYFFIFFLRSQKMALSYLLGSQGHFGQAKLRSTASTVNADRDDSALIMSPSDIVLLLELLNNTIQSRGKYGLGGYSSSTFNVKYVILALRCLLTHSRNQEQVAGKVGMELNCLLMKVLGQYTLDRGNGKIDSDAADHSCFILYLQSNYGFEESPFLPACFAPHDVEQNKDGMTDDFAAKIFYSYLQLPKIQPAGRHAAEQLLLRLKYLNFATHVDFEERLDRMSPSSSDSIQEEDMDLDTHIKEKLRGVTLGIRPYGAKPSGDIFNRPILRSRKPRKGTESKALWNNMANVSLFPSALAAVQQLSYGSNKVRHADPIDDIKIANHIANSANGEKVESYSFLWCWEDCFVKIQRNLEGQTSSIEGNDSSRLFSRFSRSGESTGEHRRSIFSCGMCTADTTM
jgi:hypothetical protein